MNKIEDEERKKAQSLEALGFDLLCFGYRRSASNSSQNAFAVKTTFALPKE